MMMLKSFFRRIVKDFRHKELLPLKLIFFVQASTLYVLYPYLTIHMRELGINVEETAIMSAVTPIVAIIMPPLAGMAADRIGNFRILLSVFSSLGGGAALLLLLVPIGRVTVNFPERVVMDVACPGKGSDVVYTMSGSHPCETSLKSEISTRIESCGYECHVDTRNDTIAMALLASRLYTVNLYDSTSNTTSSFKYVATRDEIPQNISEDEDIREKRRLSNNEFFKTSVRRLSKNAYFFPTERLFEFACTPSGFVEDFEVPTSRIYENRTLCAFPRFPANLENKTEEPSSAHSYRSKLSSLSLTEKDRDEERRRYSLERISWNGGDFQKITCGNPDTRETVVTVPLFDYTGSLEPYEILRIEGCGKKCVLTAPRKDVCSNMKMEVEYNVSMTFWLYLVIRVFIGIISGTTFAMFEGAVIAILREEKADYGLQRIYGSIGGVISSPLSGFLIDYVSTGKPYTDFRPAFYLYAVLKIVSSIFMLTINLEFKAPATNVMKDVVAVLRNVEVVALFIACFVLGTAWGYIESFLFWLIQDLGGSRSLMGITITVGGIAGIPLLVLSGPIISKIGHANVLFVGFIFYAVRLFGYSLLYNPWMTLLFEALESVTSSLSFTAAVTYAAKLSTTTTDSSIQGLLGGVYYGVGKGSGSLIGGYLMKAFDTRPTYRIFAAICLTTGLMYFFFNVLYLKKRPHVEGNDIVKKKPKNTDDRNGLKKSPPEIVQDEKSKEKSIEMDRVDAKNGRISRDIEAFYNLKRLENGEKIPTNDTTSFEQSNREIEKLRMYDRTNYGFVHDESERCDVEDGESMRKKEITVVPGV